MSASLQLYIILLVGGLFLVGAEIFLPGGVIGVMGALALLAAVGVGFVAFGRQGGLLSTLAIVVLAGICIVIWVKYFPKTHMGKSLTLEQDGSTFKSGPADVKSLLGKDGVAVSILRPSGIAKFDGRRVDVIADGSWIESGRPIRVTGVEGFRVMVRETAPAPDAKDNK